MSGIAMNYYAKEPGTATYQDILDAPEDVVAQIVNGKLSMLPGAAPRHQRASLVLGGDIERHFRKQRFGPDGWHIVPDTNVHLSPLDIVRPDLSGWRTETLPEIEDVAHIDVVPDWVCEFISPGSEKLDRHDKFAAYAKFGVKHYWMIDHRIQVIEAYALENGRWTSIGIGSGHDTIQFAPFELVEIQLADLWSEIGH